MAEARYIILEDGRRVLVDRATIDDAVFRAGMAVWGCDLITATVLGQEIAEAAWWFVETKWSHREVFIEDLHWVIAQLLVGTGHAQMAGRVNVKNLRVPLPRLLRDELADGSEPQREMERIEHVKQKEL